MLIYYTVPLYCGIVLYSKPDQYMYIDRYVTVCIPNWKSESQLVMGKFFKTASYMIDQCNDYLHVIRVNVVVHTHACCVMSQCLQTPW